MGLQPLFSTNNVTGLGKSAPSEFMVKKIQALTQNVCIIELPPSEERGCQRVVR
ncbi:hypothetical protein REIFOR_01841 [Reinekea forsetii]|jgi:hypothetical protein|uniref:Uncharacterized protein n=1 Tax=Reinekea forsetii TaxID=1336806 RepID=A0A2K8KQF5_9GAMM|nr:hypothetical protein REIFOR_01841 [Reinekea forsetii]